MGYNTYRTSTTKKMFKHVSKDRLHLLRTAVKVLKTKNDREILLYPLLPGCTQEETEEICDKQIQRRCRIRWRNIQRIKKYLLDPRGIPLFVNRLPAKAKSLPSSESFDRQLALI